VSPAEVLEEKEAADRHGGDTNHECLSMAMGVTTLAARYVVRGCRQSY
jgi:hypothetical protein